MRRVLRPATLVVAVVLVSLAACSSPTAPAPVQKQAAPALTDDVTTPTTATDTTSKSGYIYPNG
jgi:hypothetical protein